MSFAPYAPTNTYTPPDATLTTVKSVQAESERNPSPSASLCVPSILPRDREVAAEADDDIYILNDLDDIISDH